VGDSKVLLQRNTPCANQRTLTSSHSQKVHTFGPGHIVLQGKPGTFAIGNYSNSVANVLTDGCWLDKVAALHRSQHSENNGAILSLLHDMVLELLHIDSVTRCHSDIQKGPKFLELYDTEDRSTEK